jgi:hypothetical protein
MMFARAVVITALFAGVPASVALAQTVADPLALPFIV